jgi:transcription elongation factor GreA
MADNQRILLTKDGLREIKEEFEGLVKEKRPKAVKRLAEAKSQGDLKENSEYSASVEELSFIDGRISELEDIIKRAQVADSPNGKVINIGSIVSIHSAGKEHTFHIVGEWEADPREKKISHKSPLGKALVGRKKGDEVEVTAPAGKVVYKILDIK